MAQKYNINPYLLAAVARTESGFNPEAESQAGAVGLMQLLPDDGRVGHRARWLERAEEPGADEPCRIAWSWAPATCHSCSTPSPTPRRLLAAYNAGQNAVRSWVEKAGGSDLVRAGGHPVSRDAGIRAPGGTLPGAVREGAPERLLALRARRLRRVSEMASFRVRADYELKGDQPEAVAKLAEGLHRGDRFQTLLGVTGFRQDLHHGQHHRPDRQADAGHGAQQDSRGPALQRVPGVPPRERRGVLRLLLRLLPARGLPPGHRHLHREGLLDQPGDRPASPRGHLQPAHAATMWSSSPRSPASTAWARPQEYLGQVVLLKEGDDISRDEVFAKLVKIHYERNDIGFTRGKFRVRGESFEVWPAYDDYALRVSLWGDLVEEIVKVDPLTQEVVARLPSVAIYPATHFVTSEDAIERSLVEIAAELEARVAELEAQGKQLEAFRLRQRTQYDMEMLRELGYCNGIENYSRILAGRRARRAALHAARLLPRRFPGAHRRVAHDRAAVARHVRGRPQPQDHAGGARFPPALSAGQPAAPLRRVHRAGAAGGVRLGHARGVGDVGVQPRWWSSWCGPPAWSTPGGGAAYQAPDRQPDERDPRRAWTRASAPWSPRSPRRWPRT